MSIFALGVWTVRAGRQGLVAAHAMPRPVLPRALCTLSAVRGSTGLKQHHVVASPILSQLGSRALLRGAAASRAPMQRLYSTPAAPAAPVPPPPAADVPPTTRKVVAYHLLVSAALVFLIIIVGGITRLTESGLSITEWNPGLKGMRLPQTDEEWHAEWDKYKESPEFKMLNSKMTLDDFKSIFMWEWSHRILGRFIGAFFVVPAALFAMRRGMTTRSTRWKLLAIAAGIGFQGFLGWYMVASGLKNPYELEPVSTQPRPDWTPRVDHFRLAAHLGTAFVVYMGMVYTAVEILRDASVAKKLKSASPAEKDHVLATFLRSLQNPTTRRFRGVALAMLAFTFTTAMYGAFVAGLDAGLVYSEFPFMGERRLLPPKDELLDPRYGIRNGLKPSTDTQLVFGNVTQNPVTVQAIHRYLGLSTLGLMFGFLYYAKRVKESLPKAAPRFATGAAHMTGLQALLGITTLIYMVPIPLASLHQAGSVVVLTMLTCVLAVTRKPSQAFQALAKARQHATAAARP
ncbi:Similar to S.cerevisiae protein COX15 (Protein required for the hydroxylation of heme O to form heme A) [Malassezia sympodialis ATCC 42132]|uniref:Similar to S.cerevisiae protein COX15 (Protein required for the hydroxylation of heme O to form heme A) n=1 Tax=Malassezia sympodialis (strain ATCC 42132) TaxID=1230383 RepID=A0A1M8A858_MALS4|nr:Similar to S.cerevisiae protein COX15 (Protein required for the hydroxylation of heme O to form heme A) [Malassezia sympodialis ATCC 42132]